jgi:hypothetical protein
MDVWQNKLKAFCKVTNQDRNRSREQEIGFGRSRAQNEGLSGEKGEKNNLTSAQNSGNINIRRFNSKADPMFEVAGSAFDSNPKEVKRIMKNGELS